MRDASIALEEKIRSREAIVAVIGLGYVGLPLVMALGRVGFPVVGIDIDSERLREIEEGDSDVAGVPREVLVSALSAGRLRLTEDFDALREVDAMNICVPTPFTKTKDPDISAIVSAGEGISKRLRRGHLVILRSTTYPETTEKVLLPLLARSGLEVGKAFFLAFCPERIDPGNRTYSMENTPAVVGGVTERCTELASLLCSAFVQQVVPVSSPRTAEMAKLLENIFRSVNIALVNELARLCERMGNIDIWEVIEAASTKPFGFMPFYPGPGIGGHCILVDPYYLSWKAREYDFHVNFIELAAQTNENMPFYVADRVIAALGGRGVSASEANILVLGAAFKRDVDDVRNSPALKVIQLLAGFVKKVSYNDPYIPSLVIGGKSYHSVELSDAILEQTDCVLIATDHTSYDYERILGLAKLVVDTRNATGRTGRNLHNVLRLGCRST
jgi:UDP-N-acetyl-D-glucosamine dehydrogenase